MYQTFKANSFSLMKSETNRFEDKLKYKNEQHKRCDCYSTSFMQVTSMYRTSLGEVLGVHSDLVV